MRRKRSIYDIYADVLKVIRALRSASITKISYGAELPVDRAKKVVDILVKAGLVRKIVKGNRVFYVVTEKGLGYLEAYFKLREYLSEETFSEY